MSYDLAVWEGPRPEDDAAATAAFTRLYAEHIEGETSPPTEPIRQYVGQLLAHWPDLGDTTSPYEESDSPWSDSPLLNNASGPLFYFGMSYSGAEEAVLYSVERAQALGLVCFDPQVNQLLT